MIVYDMYIINLNANSNYNIFLFLLSTTYLFIFVTTMIYNSDTKTMSSNQQYRNRDYSLQHLEKIKKIKN